jgi:hypothetical protein
LNIRNLKIVSVKKLLHLLNGWFTQANIFNALSGIAEWLKPEVLENWINPYLNRKQEEKRVGVIMAGNIPLVGFHDFLAVLMSGNKFTGKLSSQDKVLLPVLADILIEIEPDFNQYIQFIEYKLENYDAVIATGSNNSSRYFEYYFGHVPHIIRKNRNSVAVITGREEESELKKLEEDIFSYFGLGCRNISKLFVPDGYKFDSFFQALYENNAVINHHKYANNYNFHRTMFLMNKDKFWDNGFLLIKEYIGLSAPVSVLYYETYSSENNLTERLNIDKEHIQCIALSNQNYESQSHDKKTPSEHYVKYGNTQKPRVDDYADGINTLDFLFNINNK